MNFTDILDQSIAWLQRQGRVSYRALKRQFDLDEDGLEDLKYELIEIHQVAIDQDRKMLIWVDKKSNVPSSTQRDPQNPLQTGTSELMSTGERRQLTVLFCDLVGSTPLSERLDPEDLRDVIREYQSICASVVRRYGGYIARYFGDGILVYFGYPRAQEDAPYRSVRAGLGILDAIRQWNKRIQSNQNKGTPLALQVGLGAHTGLVVAGDLDRNENLESMAIIGDTPNIAARLQGLATPDQLVVSEVTYRLTEGFFECEDLKTHTLRGISEPLHVYRVLRETAARGRINAARTRTPLVGRTVELELLQSRWEKAKCGESQTALVSGEAGIGKSRLVEKLKEHAVSDPQVRVAECYCSPFYQNTSLHPIIDFFKREALQVTKEDSAEDKLTKVEEFLVQHGFPLKETVPLFATLLSIPVGERYAPLTLSPQIQKQSTIDALTKILLIQAKQQPVLFIVEDLQWVDPSTLDLLTLLGEQPPHAPFMSLFTHRTGFISPWAPHDRLTHLRLARILHE